MTDNARQFRNNGPGWVFRAGLWASSSVRVFMGCIPSNKIEENQKIFVKFDTSLTYLSEYICIFYYFISGDTPPKNASY